MRISWNVRHLFVSLLVLALLFTGAFSSASLAKTKLRLAMWINVPDWVQPVKDLLKEYEKENPDVEVDLFHMVWGGYHEKLLTMVAGGTIPDVMLLSRLYMPSFALQNIIAPIDEFVARDKGFDVRRDVTEIKSGTFQGKLYGIPIWGGPSVLRFDADAFEKYGVMSPLQYVKQQNWNWSTFVEVGRKLTKDTNGDGKTDQYGVWVSVADRNWWVSAVRQNGGEILSEDGTRCLINSPAAAGAFQYLLDLMYRYGIAPVPGASGTAVMGQVWSTEAVTRALEVKDLYKMDIAPLPAGKAGYAHVSGGCPVCISKTTRHPEEAYKFAKWFAFEIDRKLNTFPASRKVFDKEYLGRMMKYFSDPRTTLIIALTSGAPEPSVHPKAFELENAWTQVLTETQAGKLSAEMTVKRLEEAINNVLLK